MFYVNMSLNRDLRIAIVMLHMPSIISVINSNLDLVPGSSFQSMLNKSGDKKKDFYQLTEILRRFCSLLML